MRTPSSVIAGLAAVAAFACDQTPTAPPAPEAMTHPQMAQAGPIGQDDQRTPFQRSIMQAIAERQAQGLPVPTHVEYEYQASSAPTTPAPLRQGATPTGQQQTIIARTTIEFTEPVEAGLDQWPNVVVKGEVPKGGTGFVHEGDYTQLIKDQIAKQYPNADVDLEQGPRTYTFAESLIVATPEPGGVPAMGYQMENLGQLTSTKDLLMGFTVLGPNVDYHIGFDVSICVFWFFGCVAELDIVNFWAGFKLDWTIGTRLPMALSVVSPNPVVEGSTFAVTSAATGEDWDASDFDAVGVSPEDGNEFVLMFVFKLGVFLEVFEADVVNLGVDIDLERTSSFATPLGPGAMFDLPSIDVSIWGFDVAVAEGDVGISLTPQAGSDRYTADWLMTGEGSGSGSVTYTSSGQTVTLGSVMAIDGPGTATVHLSNPRYYFNQFGLDLGLYFYLSVLGYGGTWNVPITNFDLSGLTGGLYVGPHQGTPGTLDLLIPIENVPPTVTLSRAGAVMIGGRPTFLAGLGETLSFSGEAADPGRDDLTLTWDWNDGPPAPDLSTIYSVPHTVTESQSHAFGGACLYEVTLTAVDDDDARGEDRVPVVATGLASGNAARLEGYWQHQFARAGRTDFDDATLECYLRIVQHMSTVFGELRDVTAIPAAHDVLFMGQNGGSAQEQLDRELLVAWLNFANGAYAYDDLVGTRGDGAAGLPVGDVLANAERVRTNPASTAQQIRKTTDMVHQLAVAVISGSHKWSAPIAK